MRVREQRVGGLNLLSAASLAILIAWVLVACSGDGGQGAAPTDNGGGTPSGGHAIHVFAVNPDGARRELKFGPVTDAKVSPVAQSNGLQARALHIAANDGGTLIQEPPSVEAPGSDPQGTAWELVRRAQMQCEGEGPYVGGGIPPWLGDNGPESMYGWYTYTPFGFLFSTHVLRIEQNLLCVADKLAEIADTVTTVVWPALSFHCNGSAAGDSYTYGSADGGPTLCQEYLEWRIPPQADADRFIVRDLAIHSLGMLATVDAMTVQGLTNSQTFAKVANGSMPVNGSNVLQIFGVGLNQVPEFPPSASVVNDGTTDHAADIARSALQIEAQILRGAGNLLHDLIRRSVYSDLAAAEKLAAHTSDPDTGTQNAWGLNGPYGTLAHAARVLAGRWEIGRSLPANNDPRCQGLAALELLTGKVATGTSTAISSAYGNELTARTTDRPIRTKGEALASSLVDRAGIVIPSGCLKTMSNADLRKVLVDQLVLQEQNGNQVASTGTQQAVFERLVGRALDPEVRFGFERAYRTYRLITNSEEAIGKDDAGVTCHPITIPAEILKTGAKAASMPTNGVVIEGGIGRSRLATDPMARAGGLMAASQCAMGSGSFVQASGKWSVWGTTEQDLNPTVADPLPQGVFQDAFAIGQALERRLAFLGAQAPEVLERDKGPDIGGVVRGGIAELRSWAGAGSVRARVVGETSANLSLEVLLSGVDYSELGVSPGAAPTRCDANCQQTIIKAFGFVYGEPWVAECAAGVRQDCPKDYFGVAADNSTSPATAARPSAYIQFASRVEDNADMASPVDYGSRFGVVGPVFKLVVPLSSQATPNFAPPTEEVTRPTNKRVYMVRMHDPDDPAGRGRVLGTLRTTFGGPQSTPVSGFAIAPMQRELLHAALDLGKWVGARPPRIGDRSAGKSSGYCVDGVPRDVFVPLENELTADDSQGFENSWKHYLSMAQQAAQRADELGQELIKENLQIDERKEASREALADLCGDFAAIDGVQVGEDGKVISHPSDPTLDICLDEPTVDVVFMAGIPSDLPQDGVGARIGSDPREANRPAWSKWIRDHVLNCTGSAAAATNELCKSTKLLTFDALTVVKPTDLSVVKSLSKGGLQAPCDTLGDVAASLWNGNGFRGTDFRAALGWPVFDPSSWSANGLTMFVDYKGNWSVSQGATKVMDSVGAELWPGCLRSNKCGEEPLAKLLNAAFRHCPGSTTDENLSLALGSCDPEQPVPSLDPRVREDGELNSLRWRVMQGMWMVASSSGALPANMFTMPVPIMTGLVVPNGLGEDLSAFYAGKLVPTNARVDDLAEFRLATDSRDVDAVTLDSVFEIAPAWSQFDNAASAEMPSWYRRLYSYAGCPECRHKLVGNWPLGFDHAGFQLAHGGAKPEGATTLSLTEIVDRGSYNLDGLVCPHSSGPPSAGTEPSDGHGLSLWEYVALAKMGYEYVNLRGVKSAPCLANNLSGVYGTGIACFGAYKHGDVSHPSLTFDTPVLSCLPRVPEGCGIMPSGPPTSKATVWAADRLRPAETPPWARAFAFAGSGIPNGTCGAMQHLVGAAAIACAATPGTQGTELTVAPTVNSVADIPRLELWLSLTQEALQYSVATLYLEKMPARVIADFKNGQVGTGSKKGQHGAQVLQMEQAVNALPGAWARAVADVRKVHDALSAAKLAIAEARLRADAAEIDVALRRISLEGKMAQESLGFFNQALKATMAVAGVGLAAETGGASLMFTAAAAAGTISGVADSQMSLDTARAEMTELNRLASTNEALQATAVGKAMVDLTAATGPAWADMQTTLDGIRGNVATILTAAEALQLTQAKAQYQAAKGTGADFVSIAGQTVKIPVNTVLRRQSNATRIRYERALNDAKALTYMARRAIEQRLGVPLDAISTRVGPLDPPATWADDLCSLTGIDYGKLASVDAGAQGTPADEQAINQFSDAFIGDYVAKLQSFVDYFNMQYPSHEGDDTAVLSVREDLLGPVAQCTQLASNRILNSGRLDKLDNTTGWTLHGCEPSAPACLAVLSGSVLADPLDGPSGPRAQWGANAGAGLGAFPDLGSGISWLVDAPVDAVSAGDAGVTSDDGGVSSLPPGMVSQTVTLEPGTYVLSWWDQARTADGSLLRSPGTAPDPYVVRVMDAQWGPVARFDDQPHVAAQGGTEYWSARRAVAFTVTQSGDYHVAFQASTRGVRGSLAIANVQLEVAPPGNEPSAYIETNDSRMVRQYNCPRPASSLRAAFRHDCDPTHACYYELTMPMLIDTDALNAGDSNLAGKLAKGNYNFRHISTAVNLVGTGVRDCGSTPSSGCIGTGYTEYTLSHDGTAAGILDYNGDIRFFNFGLANIQHGKALTTERFITMPISSTDLGLIGQAGISHMEFRGRPLDGAYTLRIWDSPALHWDRLEDIQIVLNYRYWSQIVSP